MRRILAWGVHGFTALGALLGVLALTAVDRGAFSDAVLYMLAALTIDAVDGMLARAVGVTRHAPQLDGRRLDDIVDYLNYVIVPVVFLLGSGLLPHWSIAVAPVLASAYGFARVDAKTEDGFFLGFPSYWNVIAIYAWLLDAPPVAVAAIVSVGAALVFVPWKYIYPSQLRRFRLTTFALSLLCVLAVAYAVLDPVRGAALHLVEISLIYPAWYLLLSLWLGGLHRPAN